MTRNKFSRVPSDIFPTGVFELQVQYSRRSETRIKLTSADDVATFSRSHIYSEGSIEYLEQFYVLMLDRSNQLYAWKQISVGGVSATFTDPKLIFQTALLCHAPQIILVHNHPSGNTQPSLSDIQMTKRLKEGGELLEIKVLDHVILTRDGMYSFADDGQV
jgi:DNA repair protein RadC